MGKRKAAALRADEEEDEGEFEAPAAGKKRTTAASTRSGTRASTRSTRSSSGGGKASAAAAPKAASPTRRSSAAKRRRVSKVDSDEEEEEEEDAPSAANARAPSPSESPAASEVEVEQLPFKNMKKSKLAEYQAAGRRPVFKNIKQILKLEPTARDLPPSVPSYNSINAPPSLVPAKKYCDVTGFVAPYTDPRTGLRYASTEVFQYLQTLPYDYVQRFLALRNAASKLR